MLTRGTPGGVKSKTANTLRSEEGGGWWVGGRQRGDLPVETSYLTDEGSLLARSLPRAKLLGRVGGKPEAREVARDEACRELMAEVMRGVYRRVPDKASYVLKDRRAGTMSEVGEGRVLPTRFGEVRLREEHVECGVVAMGEIRSTGTGMLGMVREGFVKEFRDLYEIVDSMEIRKWDVGKGDVYALFEWFKMLENCVRIYVVVSQGWYTGAGQGDWGLREKRKVIEAAERVVEMKRVMVAMGDRCGTGLGRLRRRVEEFVCVVLRFLEDEYERIGKSLENGFVELMKIMGKEDCGKDGLVLLGRGTRNGDWGKKMGGWRAFKRVRDRHWVFVDLFIDARREYRTMYGRLGGHL